MCSFVPLRAKKKVISSIFGMWSDVIITYQITAISSQLDTRKNTIILQHPQMQHGCRTTGCLFKLLSGKQKFLLVVDVYFFFLGMKYTVICSHNRIPSGINKKNPLIWGCKKNLIMFKFFSSTCRVCSHLHTISVYLFRAAS